ncbi:MAG: hypothetical protein ABR910_09060 [Acidobacteriaceae bacterium]|jgi:hypothetical protein
MGLHTKFWIGAIGVLLCLPPSALPAQDAKQIVRQAVDAELAANRNDLSHWRYMKTEDGGNKSVVVETESGAITRHLEENGRPASPAIIASDNQTIQKFIRDPSLQRKQRENGAHDEKSAAELLDLLPQAFDWKLDSETPDSYFLSFRPDSNFRPPDMEARVMGEMAGTLVVDKRQHRIQTMKGALSEDVNIGFGILGRLRRGGTFNVERRQVAPNLWQITETHVHIEGRALFFKTIGQQQDEVKFDFALVPPGTTLEQAVVMLNQAAK